MQPRDPNPTTSPLPPPFHTLPPSQTQTQTQTPPIPPRSIPLPQHFTPPPPLDTIFDDTPFLPQPQPALPPPPQTPPPTSLPPPSTTDSLTPTQRRRLRLYLRRARTAARRSRARPRNTPLSYPDLLLPTVQPTPVTPCTNPLTTTTTTTTSNSTSPPLSTTSPVVITNVLPTERLLERRRPHVVDRMDKKTARVIRNREVALRARQAAKAKLHHLESENSSLRVRAEDLELENSTLKRQIESLRQSAAEAWDRDGELENVMTSANR